MAIIARHSFSLDWFLSPSGPMRTLHVNLPSGIYPIHIGANILAQKLPEVIDGRSRVIVVTNEILARLYPDLIAQTLAPHGVRVDTITVPDGESYKTLETLSAIYDRLMDLEANRKIPLIAFGGGVVGDMAGFAAATFMRGMPFVQVPTTLLAHVDSSVGGKTAVNHAAGKNAIGAFKQPIGVVIDLAFLETLPERELKAGLFELIKHGIIRDPELFDFLAERTHLFATRDWEFWEEAVHRSCRVKAEVVEADEQEHGLRAILNFGHTLAHLIETHTGYTAYLHGEAVGVGMLYAAHASKALDLLSEQAFDRIGSVLRPLVTPVTMAALKEEDFAGLLMHDKKAAEGSLRFVTLRGMGKADIRENTTPKELWPLFQDFLKDESQVLSIEAA